LTPKPLFDTLEYIDEETPEVIHQYFQTLSMTEAAQEYTLTIEFLKSYIHSEDTFNSYRREVERLLQWTWLVLKRPIQSLTRNDCRDYLLFVQAPPANWIGVKNVARFINSGDGLRQFNPQWHPFTVRLSKAQIKTGSTPNRGNYSMSPASVQAVYASLSSYFNFLMQENYLSGNPMQLLRQKNRLIRKVQNKKSHAQTKSQSMAIGYRRRT